MAYSNFTPPDVPRTADLFADVPPVPADPAFRDRLTEVASLVARTDTPKARSVLLTAPVIIDVWQRSRRRVSMLSGVGFGEADAEPCDFMLGHGPQLYFPTAPVAVVVRSAIGGRFHDPSCCVAEMMTAWQFNAQEGAPTEHVYGVVTTGSSWRFLRLTEGALTLDVTEHQLPSDLDRVLGVLLHVLGRNPLPA